MSALLDVRVKATGGDLMVRSSLGGIPRVGDLIRYGRQDGPVLKVRAVMWTVPGGLPEVTCSLEEGFADDLERLRFRRVP